jgi:predicted secreted protein
MAKAGNGTLFRRWNSSTAQWDNIGEITNIDGPNKSRDTHDTTTLDTVDGYRSFIGGFRDPGEVTLSMNFTRDTYDTMNTDYEDDDNQNYEIVLPDDDTSSFEFEGLVTNLGLAVPVDGLITSNVTIKVSGSITTESGSGPSAGA